MRRFTWLTLLIAVVAGAAWAALDLARTPPATPVGNHAPTPAADLPLPQTQFDGRGQRLVEQALATLDRRINVRAKLRLATSLRGKRLPGNGAYWQRGAGNQRRTRWEVTTLVAQEKASLVQVFDSNELWTDRQLPTSRDVTRVHLVRLSRELATSPDAATATPAALRHCELLASGGLSGLLAELLEKFVFDQPTSVRLGKTPALAVIGHWKPDALAQLKSSDGDLEKWPEQLPHHVLVVLGQADLFPYLIEYRNAADAALAGTPAGRTSLANPLARYEMFDVQFAVQMDPDLFRYTPPEDGAKDITPQVRERMLRALRPTLPETPGAARPNDSMSTRSEIPALPGPRPS